MDYIIEAIVIAASSTGVFGAIIAALLSKAFRKAKEDADNRRNERYEGELLRSEYEELSAELQNGEDISSALESFCRKIIQNAHLDPG